MSININSKSSLVIAGSAALAGAVIFGFTKFFDVVKSKKTKDEEFKDVAEPEEKSMKAVEDSEE